MAESKTISDVLEFAISREVEANVFYSLISEYSNDPHISAICNELAKEELRHKSNLELEINKNGMVVPENIEFHRDESHMNPLDHIVNNSKIMDLNTEQLLLIAIEKEKLSFRLYVEMATTSRNEQSRETLLSLAEEESRHRVMLELEYNRFIDAQKKQDDF